MYINRVAKFRVLCIDIDKFYRSVLANLYNNELSEIEEWLNMIAIYRYKIDSHPSYYDTEILRTKVIYMDKLRRLRFTLIDIKGRK